MNIPDTSHPWSKANSLQELETTLRPDLGLPAMKVSGVYIWGIHLADRYFPYYVGKVGRGQGLYNRIFQHVGELAGGLKTIYSLEQFYEVNFEPQWMGSGTTPLYTPGNFANLTNEFYRKHRLQQTVSDFIEHMFVVWVEIEEEKHRTQMERLVWQLLIQSGCPASNMISGKIDPLYFAPRVQEPLSLELTYVFNRFIKTTMSNEEK